MAIAHLPPREGSNSPLATVHPSSEDHNSSNKQYPGIRPPYRQVFLHWQLLTFLPGKEAILPRQLYTLPQKVTALPLSRHQVWQLLTFLLGKEAVLSPELHTFPRKMSAHPRLLPSIYTVREIAPLRSL